MPKVRRTNKSESATQTSTAVLDPPQVDQDELSPEGRIHRRIEELTALPFFAMLKAFTEKEWSQHSCVYIYRLDPKVVNAEKEAYIEKVRQPIDEDYIRDMEGGGGGVYLVRINLFESEGKHMQKPVQEKVVIAGTPRFLPGQRFKTSGGDPGAPAVATPPAAPAPSNTPVTREGIVEIVTEAFAALERNKGDQNAAIQQVVETMKVANTASIEILSAAARRDATSSTGNPILDKVLDKTLENLTKEPVPPPPPAPPKTLLEQLTEMKAMMDFLQPKQKENDVVKMVESLKAIGVEIGGGAGGGWKEQLGVAAIELVKGAPALLAQFAQMVADNQEKSLQMQRENFQRALIAEQVKQGKAVVTHVPEPAPPGQTTQATPAGPAATPSQPSNVVEFPKQETGAAQPAAFTEFMMNKLLEFIVMQFNAGTNGSGTADIVDQVFPGAAEQMAGYFKDTAAVVNFAKTNTILKEIAAHKDFQEFAQEFISQVQKIVLNGGDLPPAA